MSNQPPNKNDMAVASTALFAPLAGFAGAVSSQGTTVSTRRSASSTS
jgi:hypothetical protein